MLLYVPIVLWSIVDAIGRGPFNYQGNTGSIEQIDQPKAGERVEADHALVPAAAGLLAPLLQRGGAHTYQYDNLYRLTQVTYPGPATDTYSYDPVGNRVSKNATSYTYDDADQMLTAGGVNYGYDANGNQTSRGSDTFSYDHENKLTQGVISGATSTHTYIGDGLRLSRTSGGVTTNYTWDVAAGLPLVLQDGTNTYVYGLGLISATDNAGNQTYHLDDGLGSTTDLTDGTGTAIAGYSYDVFGAIRSQTGCSSNYWLFTGEQRDGESSSTSCGQGTMTPPSAGP